MKKNERKKQKVLEHSSFFLFEKLKWTNENISRWLMRSESAVDSFLFLSLRVMGIHERLLSQSSLWPSCVYASVCVRAPVCVCAHAYPRGRSSRVVCACVCVQRSWFMKRPAMKSKHKKEMHYKRTADFIISLGILCPLDVFRLLGREERSAVSRKLIANPHCEIG